MIFRTSGVVFGMDAPFPGGYGIVDLPDMKTAALDARNASEDRLKSDGAPGKLRIGWNGSNSLDPCGNSGGIFCSGKNAMRLAFGAYGLVFYRFQPFFWSNSKLTVHTAIQYDSVTKDHKLLG